MRYTKSSSTLKINKPLIKSMAVREMLQRFGYYCLSKINKTSRNFHLNSLYQSQTGMEDRPVEKSIREKIQSRFSPLHLEVINESYMHNVPKGSETHFKVFIVSKEFENMQLINRHRVVNSLLEEELKNGVHALSIVAKAPSQWKPDEGVEPSPKCLGGFGK